MPSITTQPGNNNETDNFIPTNKGGPRYNIPPPTRPGQRPEGLDRRIRNLEALGNGVFIGNTLASYMALPGLVGFWPMSSVQRSTGNAYDLSGQGRTLTYTGNPVFTYYNGLVPYIIFDGTGDYLSRTDETDLDITGTETIFTSGAAGLTMGGWFWIDTTGTEMAFMGKYTTTGNQRSYILYKSTGGTVDAIVSSDGSTSTITTGSAVTIDTWYFAVVRFIPSTSVDIFVNATKSTNTTSIPASIFNSTAPFQIGALNAGGADLLSGQASLCFLCANALGDDLISSLFQSSRVLFGV